MGSTTTLSGSWQSPSVRHLSSQNSVLATACLLYPNLPRYSSGMQAGTTPGLNSTLEARARIAISLANVLLFHNGCCTTFAIPMSLRGGVSLRAREKNFVPVSLLLITSYFLPVSSSLPTDVQIGLPNSDRVCIRQPFHLSPTSSFVFRKS